MSCTWRQVSSPSPQTLWQPLLPTVKYPKAAYCTKVAVSCEKLTTSTRCCCCCCSFVSATAASVWHLCAACCTFFSFQLCLAILWILFFCFSQTRLKIYMKIYDTFACTWLSTGAGSVLVYNSCRQLGANRAA